MKIKKLKVWFKKYSDSALLTRAENVALNMANIKEFENSTPSVAEMLQAISEYSDALAAAVDGGRNAVAEKNKKREALEEALRQFAKFVEMIAKGDIALLTSCGIEVASDRTQQPLTGPIDISVKSGANSGEAEVKLTGMKNARSFIFEYTTDPLTENSKWEQETDTKSKMVLPGLPPAGKVWIRGAAVGKDRAKIYSKPVLFIVQ